MEKIKFIEPNKGFFGILFRFFGIELNTKLHDGYFHQFGYSGKQKNNEKDIVIIEKLDGTVTTTLNKNKYFKK
jgi:hypothetical protein